MKRLLIIVFAASICCAQDPVTSITAAQSNLTAVQTALANVQTQLATALTSAKTQNSTISSLQAQVASLTAQIANLTNTPVPPPPVVKPPAGAQGVMNYTQLFNSNWDPYTTTTDAGLQSFLKTNINWGITYSPYFDTKLPWFPNAYFYFDIYAIYNPSALATQHSEWIAKDVNGNPLYIPWGCNGTSCPQYAGDISNPNFRSYQISQMKTIMARGYKGIYLDDVNMWLATGNGGGSPVPPKDPSANAPMTLIAWEGYMAAFTQQIRSSFPTNKIMHNIVWTAGSPANDPKIATEMSAADVINMERGFGDTGITGGTGQFSLGTYMLFMDAVHVLNKPVNIMDYFIADEPYSLACYFLVQESGDTIGFQNGVPSAAPNYMSGFDPQKLFGVNLGLAKAFHFWNAAGLWERDFTNGVVYVNEPGGGLKTVNVPPGLHTVSGQVMSQITLGPMQGVILVNN